MSKKEGKWPQNFQKYSYWDKFQLQTQTIIYTIGATALMVAVKYGNVSSVEVLIKDAR